MTEIFYLIIFGASTIGAVKILGWILVWLEVARKVKKMIAEWDEWQSRWNKPVIHPQGTIVKDANDKGATPNTPEDFKHSQQTPTVSDRLSQIRQKKSEIEQPQIIVDFDALDSLRKLNEEELQLQEQARGGSL